MKFGHSMIRYNTMNFSKDKGRKPRPQVSIIDLPNHPNTLDQGWDHTGGGCYAHSRCLTEIGAMLESMSEYIDIVAYRGVDPKTALKEFMKIDEFALSRRYKYFGILDGLPLWPDQYLKVFAKPEKIADLKRLSFA
jgi:hypothetical protein